MSHPTDTEAPVVPPAATLGGRDPLRRDLLTLFVITAVAALVPLVVPSAQQAVAVRVLIFGLMAVGWNLMSGFGGMFSFGHAAYFGIGAYADTYLLVKHGTSPWISMVVGMVLAAGVAAIAGLTFAVIALSLSKPDAAIMSAIVFGACVGFLRHNFYPARIFMGDSGALLLGFVLAALSVQGLLKTAATVALFFPLLVLAVPIVDTTFVVARRLRHGQKVFEGDQAHLHHRFLRRGFSQPRAALTIWGWCASLAAAALATRFIPFRAHGVWHTWPTLGAAAIALVAIGFSIYVVYVLEIVKVANPYHRRRDEQLRKSA